MEVGNLVCCTSEDGTSKVYGRIKSTTSDSCTLADGQTFLRSLCLSLYDPLCPAFIKTSMHALCRFDDNEHYPGKIGKILDGGGKTFEFEFDDGDKLDADASFLKLLPLPRLLLDSVNSRVKVGMEGECYFHEDSDFYPGTVGKDNGDGTYRFDFSDGDVAESVYPHDLLKLRPAKGQEGDAGYNDRDSATNSKGEDILNDFLEDDGSADANYAEDFDVSDEDDERLGIALPAPSASTLYPSEPQSSPDAPLTLNPSNSDLSVILSSTNGRQQVEDPPTSDAETLKAKEVPPDDTSSRSPRGESSPNRSGCEREREREESAYLQSQSHIHPLLIPPNEKSTATGPKERLFSLALEFAALERKLQKVEDASFEAKAEPLSTHKQLCNSMMALKMRSKALVRLAYGESCLEAIQVRATLLSRLYFFASAIFNNFDLSPFYSMLTNIASQFLSSRALLAGNC